MCWREDTLLASSLTQTLETFSKAVCVAYPDARVEQAPFPESLLGWLETFHEGRNPGPLPFSCQPQGTEFQRNVWKSLEKIPFGEVQTYGEIARRIGCRSARPVGGAAGANPLPLFVPCHRVVGADHRLGGFSGGIRHKIRLLGLEGWKVAGEKLHRR